MRPHSMHRWAGSSPHAWGILMVKKGETGSTRFIPTCVGNTPPWSSVARPATVHPHMRGEYSGGEGQAAGGAGSSPHAWGILFLVPRAVDAQRFIPTCVGNTSATARPCRCRAVHPHMRGEYDDAGMQTGCLTGSSPHAWGIHPDKKGGRSGPRFIPTCVGNTRPRSSTWTPTAVHPHMRGEYKACWNGWAWRPGSSPHAWGIRPHGLPGHHQPRFIPTCVGNTLHHRLRCLLPPVHPHMRGEYQAAKSFSTRWFGSSPHAWGIRLVAELFVQRRRFIPTCVGNTPRADWEWVQKTVHPHMRGEYRWTAPCACCSTGSSPHAWGIRDNTQTGTVPPPVHPHMRGEYHYTAGASAGRRGSSPHAWGILVPQGRGGL